MRRVYSQQQAVPDLATITDSYFEQLYQEIVSNEIKMDQEDADEDEEATEQVEPGAAAGASPSAEPQAAPALRELTPEEAARLEKWQEGAAMFNDPDVSASKAIEFMQETTWWSQMPTVSPVCSARRLGLLLRAVGQEGN